MALADLHVHSIHSEHPSEWFLQRIGAAESYTDPQFIYKTAKDNAMNFVTITDHNRISGSLILQMQYPDIAFNSVESTVYFPEDGCKIHLLIYGLSEKQFNEVQRLRKDIYHLRHYLMQENLACSVAHATYSVNGKLNFSHLERLILMFDVFEGINGGRNRVNNEVWTNSLLSLNSDIITDLYNQYHVEPMSDNPWVKGFTGGSDDHAGFFVSKTYTYADAHDIQSFLQAIREKKTIAGGRHNDYKSLAFTIYKIAYEFSKTKSKGFTNPIIKQITDNLFEKKKSTMMDKLSISHLFAKKKFKEDPVKSKIIDLIEKMKSYQADQIDDKFDYIYQQISVISDELFIQLADRLMKNVNGGDFYSLFSSFSSALPGIFVSLPFFTSLKVSFSSQHLIKDLKKKYLNHQVSQKKILWFSDTVNDLNGVSFIVKRISNIAQNMNRDITLVASLSSEDMSNQDLPPNLINLPYIYEFNLPHYESYVMRIPSILRSMEIIARENPDEIYISTPGPLGLIALFTAKLMNIKTTGVYHTDFKMQYDTFGEEGGMSDVIEAFTRWFYMSLDTIKVPTKEYIQILSERGFSEQKMSLFRRGIEEEIFYPVIDAKNTLKQTGLIKEGLVIIYAGRVSKDKNLDFLASVYQILLRNYPDLQLIIAGDGPYLNEFKQSMISLPGVKFLGAIERKELAIWYSASDILVFPSNTDTFGMVVLEAQACGLPAVVSDIGGPKEIVVDRKTGLIAQSDQLADWVDKVSYLIELKQTKPDQFKQIKLNAVQHVRETCNWQLAIEEIIDSKHQSKDHIEAKQVPKW